MTKYISSPVLCQELIGRSEPYDLLLAQLINIKGNPGQAVIISGEAGVGKTRLIEAVNISAIEDNFQIIRSSCLEVNRSLPFAPFFDFLQNYLEEETPEKAQAVFGPSKDALLFLFPELSRFFPEMQSTKAPSSAVEKQRIFFGLALALARLAESQPLLFIIEDLHWADDASLEFLGYFTGRLFRRHILLLMTYRSDDLSPNLMHFLAEINRERLALELHLNRLTEAEAADMIQSILRFQRPIQPAFLETISRLSEGNPFFIEEILRALLLEGKLPDEDSSWDQVIIEDLRIPLSVQDAVRQRVDRLSSSARELITLAAVIGQQMDMELLQLLTGRPQDQLLKMIREMIDSQLILEGPGEAFVFRHALTQHAIRKTLLKLERKNLHLRVAEAIRSIYGEGSDRYLPILAEHYYQAGEWHKVFSYAWQAGQKAQAQYAPGTAVEHYNRAIEAVGRIPVNNQPSEISLIEIFRARGQALQIQGEFQRALADYETSLEQAKLQNRQQAEWQALVDLGGLWAERDYQQAGFYNQQALALAQQIDQPAVLARSMNRMGNWYLNVEQPQEALHAHQEAQSLFLQIKDQRGLAETLDLLGMAHYLNGNIAQGTQDYQQALALFEAQEDRQGMASVLATLSMRGQSYQTLLNVPFTENLGETVQDAERALTISRQIGWRFGEAYSLAMLGFCLGPLGHYEKALSMAQKAYAIAEEIEHEEWMAASRCATGALLLDLLNYGEAQVHLEQSLALAKRISSLHWMRNAAGMLADLCATTGQINIGGNLVDELLPRDTPARTIGQRLIWFGKAKLAMAKGDPQAALDIEDLLMAGLQESAALPPPQLGLLRGETLLALRHYTEAEPVLVDAAAGAAQSGLVSLGWRIQAALGKLYAAQTRTVQADQSWTLARTMAGKIQASLSTEDIKTLFEQNTQAYFSSKGVQMAFLGSAKQSIHPPQPFAPLTERECEVAIQVADGKSNRVIADALVIGRRTVETHVTNILTKLNFSTRAQIAGWVVKNGLAGK